MHRSEGSRARLAMVFGVVGVMIALASTPFNPWQRRDSRIDVPASTAAFKRPPGTPTYPMTRSSNTRLAHVVESE